MLKFLKKEHSLTNAAFFAAFCFFLLLFFLEIPASAKKTKALESEVESLLLEKKRVPAVNLIASDFQSATESEKDELYELYFKASRIFFADRNQQLYETALSLKRSDPVQAQAKLTESLAKEPGHLGVQLENLRILIERKDCAAAIPQAEELRKRVRFDEEINLTLAFALFCQDKLTPTTFARLKKESYRLEKDLIWKVLEGLNAGFLNEAKTREAIAQELKAVKTNYPEVEYLYWKESLVERLPKISLATKYLEACKNVSTKQLRMWMWDPYLCRRTAEVEADLEKLNNKTNK